MVNTTFHSFYSCNEGCERGVRNAPSPIVVLEWHTCRRRASRVVQYTVTRNAYSIRFSPGIRAYTQHTFCHVVNGKRKLQLAEVHLMNAGLGYDRVRLLFSESLMGHKEQLRE